MTWRDNKLYIHILEWEADRIRRAYALNVPSFHMESLENTLIVSCDEADRTSMDSIFVLELDRNADEVYEGVLTKRAADMAEESTFQNDALIVEEL